MSLLLSNGGGSGGGSQIGDVEIRQPVGPTITKPDGTIWLARNVLGDPNVYPAAAKLPKCMINGSISNSSFGYIGGGFEFATNGNGTVVIVNQPFINGNGLVAAGTLMVTTDGGKTWHSPAIVPNGLVNTTGMQWNGFVSVCWTGARFIALQAIVQIQSASGAAITTFYGISTSTDGVSWSTPNWNTENPLDITNSANKPTVYGLVVEAVVRATETAIVIALQGNNFIYTIPTATGITNNGVSQVNLVEVPTSASGTPNLAVLSSLGNNQWIIPNANLQSTAADASKWQPLNAVLKDVNGNTIPFPSTFNTSGIAAGNGMFMGANGCYSIDGVNWKNNFIYNEFTPGIISFDGSVFYCFSAIPLIASNPLSPGASGSYMSFYSLVTGAYGRVFLVSFSSDGINWEYRQAIFYYNSYNNTIISSGPTLMMLSNDNPPTSNGHTCISAGNSVNWKTTPDFVGNIMSLDGSGDITTYMRVA